MSSRSSPSTAGHSRAPWRGERTPAGGSSGWWGVSPRPWTVSRVTPGLLTQPAFIFQPLLAFNANLSQQLTHCTGFFAFWPILWLVTMKLQRELILVFNEFLPNLPKIFHFNILTYLRVGTWERWPGWRQSRGNPSWPACRGGRKYKKIFHIWNIYFMPVGEIKAREGLPARGLSTWRLDNSQTKPRPSLFRVKDYY